MNFSSLLTYTLAMLFCLVLVFRTERNRWFMTALFLLLPVAVLIFIGGALNQETTEVIGAYIITAVLGGGWWFFVGRRLKSVESQIKVWGQDAAAKPKPAELQAEVLRLQEEKEQLEAELRKLREKKD